MPDTYSLKQNAVRAAKKALADGSAPAPTYEIKTATGGGFRIAWDAEVAEDAIDASIARDRLAEIDAGTERLIDGPELEERLAAATAPVKTGTQLAKVIALLQRPEGATIADLQAATGWLPHTTRAFISVQVRRKAGLEVTTDKVEGRGRVYRVAA